MWIKFCASRKQPVLIQAGKDDLVCLTGIPLSVSEVYRNTLDITCHIRLSGGISQKIMNWLWTVNGQKYIRHCISSLKPMISFLLQYHNTASFMVRKPTQTISIMFMVVRSENIVMTVLLNLPNRKIKSNSRLLQTKVAAQFRIAYNIPVGYNRVKFVSRSSDPLKVSAGLLPSLW